MQFERKGVLLGVVRAFVEAGEQFADMPRYLLADGRTAVGLEPRPPPLADGAGASLPISLTGPVAFEEADNCHLCGFKFTMFKRRHHCRECGRSVCYEHSRRTAPLPHRGTGDAPQRVCDGCSASPRPAGARPPAAISVGPAPEPELQPALDTRAAVVLQPRGLEGGGSAVVRGRPEAVPRDQIVRELK
eukprot:SAG11_NODE_7878_length_1085_cov_1.745436_1_plen_188_part_10